MRIAYVYNPEVNGGRMTLIARLGTKFKDGWPTEVIRLTNGKDMDIDLCRTMFYDVPSSRLSEARQQFS